MNEEKKLPSFYEVKRVSSGYDTYIVGCFPRRGVYVLGVMDLEDPKAWQGGESDLVLYFALTPEELRWLESAQEKLDDLARRIQEGRPRNRFIAGVRHGREMSPELDERCQSRLKSDALEGDEAFNRWMETHPFRSGRQARTPVTDARHELAVLQRELHARGQEPTEQERKEEERRQYTLARRLLEAEAVYAAMDENSPAGQWPGLEYVSGHVHLFSTRENGDAACGYYAKCRLYDYQVQKVERAQYPAFFENCRALGVEHIRLDDGLESVEVSLSAFVPRGEESWLEEHNRGVRNAMLRSLEASGHLARHREQLTGNLQKNLLWCVVALRTRMLQELGDTLLYVPCALPPELHEQFEKDLVFSKQALAWLKKRLEQELRPRSAITGPHFEGRVAAVDHPAPGKLPLRLVHDPQEARWLVAFTSKTLCQAFVENQQEGDTVVVLTPDELYDQIEGLAGLLVDVTGSGIQLPADALEQCLTLRKEEKVSIRLESKEEHLRKAKETQDGVEGEAAQTKPQTELEKQEEVCEKTKKPGFFSRLFRRKH